MSDVIDDMLVEGEPVIWRGQPELSKAKKKPKTRRRRVAEQIAWVIGLAATGMVIFYFGHLAMPLVLRNFLGGLLVAASLFTLLDFLYATPRPIDLDGEFPLFILTDRRVMMITGPDANYCLFGRGLAAIRLEPNGEVHDLFLYGMQDDFISFTAISDGPAVEKLITSTLVAPLKGASHEQAHPPV